MAITNHERVGKALDLLRQGIAPFVEREMLSAANANVVYMDAVVRFSEDPILSKKPISEWDVAGVLKIMWETWKEVFGHTLGRAERSLVQEIRDWRNKWAHQTPFSSDDADRALDSIERLLVSISASQAEDVAKMKRELRRLVYDEQVRSEKRKSGGTLIDGANPSSLKPWREIVTPHPDVATGKYQQAEFAADLWQVHLGEGSDEYRKPSEFFRRTYLTESLRKLLVSAVERISGTGGDPVIQLQTNFGGGKTHSMLALYHLFSGAQPSDLPGVDEVMAEAKVHTLPTARRVVLVGNKISPGNPVTKPDGTVIRTLWGELAYQLGGAEAYARIAKDDENATSPGDALRLLMRDYGPTLILIDEWVAYARQLHDQGTLPAGGFETQFSFAQALTESAKGVPNCLLVISLPASDSSKSIHAQADDVEVGGIRGREALDRLRNVVGRLEAPWQPATSQEGFEIVRRRLFEPLASQEAYKQRDVIARAFSELYRSQKAEFPPDCGSAMYEERIKAAFPIHPEVFDRLYDDWSTLVKFQRTRGVLRLMAAVIHSLWEKGDRNPLILPSTIPIDDARVRNELTRYLADNWTPIIDRDVDGPNSLPLNIDNEVPNLGKLHAARRVARTIYLGSAPTSSLTNKGIEDRNVKLGCVMPGESPAIFGDAMRRLASSATYLYQDGTRLWYATQPTVTKLADDRAEQLVRDPDKIAAELDNRIRADIRNQGDFSRIHPMPHTGADVSDETETRLVILPAEFPYSKEQDCPALLAAQRILATRGNTPRLYKNTLVFLCADKVRLQDLDQAIRQYLAWTSILSEKESLDLSPFQVRQAEGQQKAADQMIRARLPETYQWVLIPEQKSPSDALEWSPSRLSGSDALAVRVSKKLKSEELLLTSIASTVLRKYLDDVPLWRGRTHVSIQQLIEDFAQYPYLPRLANSSVLITSINNGLGLLTWATDSFAYAESYDDQSNRYRGLRTRDNIIVTDSDTGLIVEPTVASQQLESERAALDTSSADHSSASHSLQQADHASDSSFISEPQKPYTRYFGSVQLDPTRVGRDASRIAEEVIVHLTSQPGVTVEVSLEIHASIPQGAHEATVRIVNENARSLHFTDNGFEKE